MVRGWVWLAALPLLVSGCVSGEAPAKAQVSATLDASGAPIDDVASFPEDRPAPWRVGDWWKYRFESRTEGVEGFELTVVVGDETPTTWSLTAVEEANANVTFFTHVPSLGPVRKSDFAVTRHGKFVPFFQFPLVEGATWTTEARGPWEATASRAELTVGSRTVPGWRIEYRAGPSLQHVIEWSPAVNWLVRESTYFGETEPRHDIVLLDWGHERKGPLKVLSATDIYVRSHSGDVSGASAAPAGQDPFTVPAEGQGLLMGMFSGGEGLCGHHFVSPPGTAVGWGGAAACEPFRLERSEQEVTPGTWYSAWGLAPSPGGTSSPFLVVEVELLHARGVTLA